jgi:MYXO-CTERM domain-containing protein
VVSPASLMSDWERPMVTDSSTATDRSIFSHSWMRGVAGLVAPTLSVTLNPLNGYRFVFILEGNVLTGEVFDLTNPGPAVATISGSDMDPSPFTTGVTGLLAAAGNDTSAADATFDNCNLAIPEPTGPALALLGLALFLRRRRQAPRRFRPSTCDSTPRDPAPPPRAHP